MKASRLINVCLLALIFEISSGAGIGQQPPSSVDLERQWKDALKAFPPWKGGIELELRSVIPSSESALEEDYLWEPRKIASDLDGNIFVTDRKACCVMKFSPKGLFLGKRGQKGQGPGDFLNPYCLQFVQGMIVVGDTGKRDVQVFSRELALIRSFKVKKAYYNLVPDDRGRFFGTPLRGSQDEALVDVIDQEGRILYSFGQPLIGNAQDWQIPNFVYLDIAESGDVLLAFQHWPVVRRYSPLGDLKATFEIDHKGMRAAERFNRERMKVPQNNIYREAIFGLRAMGESFYLLHNNPIVEVLEFDRLGHPINDYWAVRRPDYFVTDFVIQPKYDNSPLRILISESVESRIEIFSPKER